MSKQSFLIRLPFPPAILNPNKRAHWAALARAKREYRKTCHHEALAQGVRRVTASHVHVHLDFHPPDNRARDDDNMVAAFKSGRDGLADCLCVDDARWMTSHTVTRDRGNCVLVTIALDPAAVTLPVKGVAT